MKKGGGFEKIIGDMLSKAGFGLVTATEPPVRVIKAVSKWNFLVFFESKGVLDFAGPRGGRHIEFDCKDIGESRFYLSKIKPHQWIRMRELAIDGSITGIVLRMRGKTGNEDRMYGIPAHVLLDAKECGVKGLGRDDLAELVEKGDISVIEYFKTSGLVDFFDKAASLKYILPANHFKRGWGMMWKLRKEGTEGQWDGLAKGN